MRSGSGQHFQSAAELALHDRVEKANPDHVGELQAAHALGTPQIEEVHFDGLVFSGGSDLDPDLYDQEPHDETLGVVPARDRAELALLEAALARDMPVLAVCRGSQLLNVARGGDLVQHLPEVVGDEKHRETLGVFSDHAVRVDVGGRLVRSLRFRQPAWPESRSRPQRSTRADHRAARSR